MSKLFRALIISAVATGAAAVIINAVQQRASKDEARDDSNFVDAEKLSQEERAMLTDELNAML
ncbi:MAG: hypothetical protein AAF564_03040 [Bacteroidota bacterium]